MVPERHDDLGRDDRKRIDTHVDDLARPKPQRKVGPLGQRLERHRARGAGSSFGRLACRSGAGENERSAVRMT